MTDNTLNPKERIADLYDRVAPDYGQVGPRVVDTFGQRLVELSGVMAQSLVVDVACGRGASLLPAAKIARMAIGVDIAFQMVHQTQLECQRTEITNVSLLQVDGDYLSFCSASVDVILCGFGIFFFPNPGHTLREWNRVLKTGGKVGICVASGGDERWAWYEELLLAYHKQHQFPLSAGSVGLKQPAAIKDALEQAGFDDVKIIEETYEFIYADGNQWWQTKWTHGARYPLEQMGDEVLSQFKADVFARLNQLHAASSLREKWQVAYIVGV